MNYQAKPTYPTYNLNSQDTNKPLKVKAGKKTYTRLEYVCELVRSDYKSFCQKEDINMTFAAVVAIVKSMVKGLASDHDTQKNRGEIWTQLQKFPKVSAALVRFSNYDK